MIKLTIHAAEAVSLRQIDLVWVEATISVPSLVTPDPKRPGVTLSFKAIAEFGGRVLRVAHRPEGADTLIVTAYFDRSAKL